MGVGGAAAVFAPAVRRDGPRVRRAEPPAGSESSPRPGPGRRQHRRARPAPVSPMRVCASIAIHSPCGGRSRWMPRSTLMNSHSCQSSIADTPLAASAMTSRRSSGVGSSPAISGNFSRDHTQRRAGSGELALDPAPLERVAPGDVVLVPGQASSPPARPLSGGGGGGSGVAISGDSSVRIRHAVSAHARLAARRRERRLDLLDPAAGAQHARRHVDARRRASGARMS